MYRFLILTLLLPFSMAHGQTLNEMIARECEKVRPIENTDTVYFAVLIGEQIGQELNLKDTCFTSSNVSIWVGDSSLRAPCLIKNSLTRFNFKKQFRGKQKNTVFTLALLEVENEDDQKITYHIYWRKYTVKEIRKMMGKKHSPCFYMDYKSIIEMPKKKI